MHAEVDIFNLIRKSTVYVAMRSVATRTVAACWRARRWQ